MIAAASSNLSSCVCLVVVEFTEDDRGATDSAVRAFAEGVAAHHNAGCNVLRSELDGYLVGFGPTANRIPEGDDTSAADGARVLVAVEVIR